MTLGIDQLNREAKTLQMIGKPHRSATYFGRELRVGTNAGDPQEFRQ
jgi:hypothetical protein